MPAFVCSEQNCGLAFRRREHLIRHERRHTNSKPFSCSQCSRSFSRSDVLKRHILHHEKSTPSSRSASACDFCHRRKVKCDGREECARCREANRVCRRARRIPNSDPFPRESLPADTEISIHCSNAEADDQVVASLLATSHHSPRNRSESTDDARSNLNLPQPEQHPRENLRQDVTNPEENHRMEPDTASEKHAGSTSRISDLLSINVFGSGLQETSFLGLHELPPPSSRETCSVDSQRVYLEHTSPVHPSSERRPEVDRGSERDEANYSEPSSGHVLPDTQTVNFQQARSIGPPDTTGGRRASVQASNDRHNSENNDALALLGLSQSSAPGPNIFQSWEESLQASLAQSPNTNTSASGHRRQSEASYEMDELTALHSKSRTQLDFHSPRGETAWEGLSVGTPGGHSPAVFPVFPIPVELGYASAAILDKRMFDRYFSSFHNHWPILHKASFSQPQCTPELQHAVGLIGGLLEGDPDLRAPSIRLHKWLSQRVLLQAIERPSDIEHLEILQALLLNILFGWYIGETELVRMACMALPTLTMCTREAGYFRVEGVVAQDEKSASHVSRWLIREQKKRLAYAVFRLDCYLHLLRDYPPSIRVPELCLHYPCSEVAWNATTVGDWELALAREPLGRMDKTYSLTCMQALSDTIRPNLAFLLPEDFETGVVAMQSRLWEEVQHEHETTLYSVSPSFDIRQASVGIAGYGLSWQVQLDMWRSTMDHLTGRNVGFCDKSTETWFYFTAKMQYHMSFLRMYADLTLIQRLIDGLSTNNYSPSLIRRFEARIQLWTKSSNAKQALWHAVQILQQFKETALGIKASRSLVCPSTVTCLFRAAQVVWAICRSVLSCDLCETSSAQHDNTWHTHRGVKAVYDLMELQNDGELGFWNDNRAKASIGNIPFCACHMPAILDLYIESLQMSTLGWSSVTPVTDALAALKLQQ